MSDSCKPASVHVSSKYLVRLILKLFVSSLYPAFSLNSVPSHRVTPFEWQPPHPCIQEPTELESILSLHNCFWHNWGSVMQQGSDIAPA